KPHKINHLISDFFGSGTRFNKQTAMRVTDPVKKRNAANAPGGKASLPNVITTKLNPHIKHKKIVINRMYMNPFPTNFSPLKYYNRKQLMSIIEILFLINNQRSYRLD